MAQMGGTVDDLAGLENLSQESLEANLKARYDSKQIYTWVCKLPSPRSSPLLLFHPALPCVAADVHCAGSLTGAVAHLPVTVLSIISLLRCGFAAYSCLRPSSLLPRMLADGFLPVQADAKHRHPCVLV